MVSMALIVFIMYILAEAFDSGLKTFRQLKSISDMSDRLRNANNSIRRLLAADHFEGKKRMSDPNFWQDANGQPSTPREGFFRVYHANQGDTYVDPFTGKTEFCGAKFEGNDQDGLPSFRATNHALHFTAKLRGNSRGNFFSGSVPNGSPLLNLPNPDSRMQDPASTQVNAEWAEIILFTRPSFDAAGNQDTANGTPLNTLYLRQRLLVPDNSVVTNANGGNPIFYPQDVNYADWSTRNVNGTLFFNSPRDLTVPTRRYACQAPLAGGPVLYPTNGQYPVIASSIPQTVLSQQYNGQTNLQGTDVLLNDVISFDVRIMLQGGNQFVSLFHSSVTAYDMKNPSFGGTGPRAFDTWSSLQDNDPQDNDYSAWTTQGKAQSIPLYQNSASPPQQIRVRAVQVTIRIWDRRTEQTRQISIIQDL
jgi:hypothetical protein